MTPTHPGATDAARRRHRLALLTAVCCLLVLAAATALAWSWRDDLPDPIATHWNAGGRPDGFGSLASYLVPLWTAGALCVAAFCALVAFRGQSATTRRMGVASSVWITVFLAAIALIPLAGQRGATAAADTRDGMASLAVALAGSLVIAALAARAVPGDPPLPATGPVTPGAERLPLNPGERAVWIGTVSSTPILVAGGVATALVTALAIETRLWALLVVALLLAALLGTMASFDVRIDQDGLTVRSAAGWPRARVPAGEVIRASAVQVSPFRQYGGWGWRVRADGDVGIVLRRGEAIEVRRTGDRSLTVTVDGAEQAAALLNTMADQARAAR